MARTLLIILIYCFTFFEGASALEDQFIWEEILGGATKLDGSHTHKLIFSLDWNQLQKTEELYNNGFVSESFPELEIQVIVHYENGARDTVMHIKTDDILLINRSVYFTPKTDFFTLTLKMTEIDGLDAGTYWDFLWSWEDEVWELPHALEVNERYRTSYSLYSYDIPAMTAITQKVEVGRGSSKQSVETPLLTIINPQGSGAKSQETNVDNAGDSLARAVNARQRLELSDQTRPEELLDRFRALALQLTVEKITQE